MDSQWFDRITRSLAGGLSRRTLVAGLTGGALAVLARQGGLEAAARQPSRLRPPARCKGSTNSPCGNGCCAPGYICLQESGCAPANSISCGSGYCAASAGCCDGLCAPCDCGEGTVECGNTCVENQCGSDEFFDVGTCGCQPKKGVGELCGGESSAGNAECLSGVCGCASVCFCREASCLGTGGDCTTGGTAGCCTGLCVVGDPDTCVAVL